MDYPGSIGSGDYSAKSPYYWRTHQLAHLSIDQSPDEDARDLKSIWLSPTSSLCLHGFFIFSRLNGKVE